MKINKKVLHSNGYIEPFKPRYIKKKLLNETNISEEEAEKIKIRVTEKIRKMDIDEISTSTIRAEVSAQLTSRGLFDFEEDSRKLGMSVKEFEDLLQNGCKDNANIQYSPELIAKYAYDSIAKSYAFLNMPKDCADAHISGELHHHDAEFFNTRPNCFNYDLRFFAKNGLKIDGKGEMGSVAKPAKSLEVLLNHMLQAWMAGAVVFSGGQGYVNFNTLLAPFAKGRSYKDIKQAIQGFIFNCNMSLICRGGQVLFSSIGIDLSIPDVLKDEPAIGPGGIPIGVYGDYQKEADLIFRAICEVSDEKDGQGAYFRFPNLTFNIREGDLDEYSGNCKLLHELGANNPTIYYVNCTDIERSVMGALTSDTPVMTKNGFKYPPSLNVGDNVMTYTKNGKREWKPIRNIIPKNPPKKVFKITMDNNYQFKVTENHKLPTQDGIIKSENLKVGMELYDYIDETFIPYDDYVSEFIGVFLADGYIRSSERISGNSTKVIEFHVKNEWKKDKIIDLCKKNSYDYIIKTRKDKTYGIYVRNESLRDELNRCYDPHGVKHFPNWVWGDKNVVANIIKGLMFDGRKDSKYRWVWSCSDFPLVVDVMYALSYIGRPTTLYIDNRDGDSGNWRTNYRVSFGLDYKPINKTKIKSIEIVDNEDFVYDLEIEDNHNYVCGLGGIHSENCRTALPMNYAFDYEKDCMNTGNFMYSTINLPLIALEADSDEQKFWNKLGDICEIIYKTLHYRRECVIDAIYNKHMSDFLLQKDKDTEEPLYDIDRTTMTIGFCGLNECIEVLTDKNIMENPELGERILAYLNAFKDKFYERDGLRWSVIASPAESASHRFAEINKEKYPDSPVQGVKGSYYLTNSSHIPVSNREDLIEHIKNAERFHKYTLGGNILHLWLGEVWSDSEAMWRLNQKILNNGIIFWAYSKVFTHCQNCGFNLNDNLSECPVCKSKDLMTYDRCFSGDTNIFIKKDKVIKPVELKEFVENYDYKAWQVPVFDYKQQKYVWGDVKRVIKNPPEEMINISFNKGYNLTVTPQHEFYDYGSINRKSSMYSSIKANDLGIKSRIINHRCPVFIDEGDENVLGTFIGFVLGDGHVGYESDDCYIKFGFHKKEKRDYAKWLLESNNLEYRYSETVDSRINTLRYNFYIFKDNIGNPAYDIFNKYNNKRDVIEECYNIDLILGVFAGLLNSDGSIYLGRKNQIITQFAQADKEILYCFYWISMLLGTNPSISFRERDDDNHRTLGFIEMTSQKTYELLQKIKLRKPYDEHLSNGICTSVAKRVNGMCSVKKISEAPTQESYCIETVHEGHNTLFNGVLGLNCTGYYLPTKGFNKGKQQEFKDRFRHKI